MSLEKEKECEQSSVASRQRKSCFEYLVWNSSDHRSQHANKHKCLYISIRVCIQILFAHSVCMFVGMQVCVFCIVDVKKAESGFVLFILFLCFSPACSLFWLEFCLIFLVYLIFF